MKKNFSLIIVTLLSACFLSICCFAHAAKAESLQIVTTIFPEYDWVRELLGDNPADAQLTLLLDSGVDRHSFQPTATDILNISTCDLFLYVGGESDEWVEDALQEATNPDMIVINLLKTLGDRVREEETVEGMQEEEEEEDESDEEEIEYDEHVWLSLKNAQYLCDAIEAALSELDPEHADLYAANDAAYQQKLAALDEAYQQVVADASVKTLLFGDRFPFRYLTDDYGLTYYAAFSGCSAETEASFETIIFLAQKMDELGLTHIMTLEGTDHRIAQTILQSTAAKDQQILTLNSMQSCTKQDVEEGVTYLSLMEDNLAVLQEALS